MSQVEPNSQHPDTAIEWVPLTVEERRVLGVLIEKQKTSKTADSYPLSLNALTNGCNQKSNRDPILDLSDDEVEDTIAALQKRGLVMRMTGSRVDRFRHLLYEAWTRNGAELAVMAELLMRGPQTKGELRTRASRMDPIDTLEALEEVLKPLVARKLVVYLTDPDRRGAVLTHGFHPRDELQLLKTHHANAPASVELPLTRAMATPSNDAVAGLETRLAEAFVEIGHIKAAVFDLQTQLASLKKQLGAA